MSAFLVSSDHIRLLSVWAHGKRNGIDLDAINATAKTLWDANVKSLQARYEKNDDFGQAPAVCLNDASKFSRAELASVLKQCDCYDYQSCEFDGYENSEAAKIVERVRHKAICQLPGYDDAPWGI